MAASARFKSNCIVVPKRGLEPPHPCEYMDLNHARLPIPPLRHICSVLSLRTRSRGNHKFPRASAVCQMCGRTHPIQWRRQPIRRRQSKQMKEMDAGTIPGGHAAEIRRLVHDLSNALEIIVQTSYLLKLGKPDETALQWLNMMDGGVKQASEVSASLRRYVIEHAAGR